MRDFPAIIRVQVPCPRTHKTFSSLLVTLEEGSYDPGSSLAVFSKIFWEGKVALKILVFIPHSLKQFYN